MKALVAGLLMIAAGCSTTRTARIVPMDRDLYRVVSPAVGVRSDEKAFVYDQASQFCKSANKEVEIVILNRTGPDAPTTSRLPSAARADLLFKCVAKPAGTP
jgi:hypothetical protein